MVRRAVKRTEALARLVAPTAVTVLAFVPAATLAGTAKQMVKLPPVEAAVEAIATLFDRHRYPSRGKNVVPVAQRLEPTATDPRLSRSSDATFQP